MRMLAMALVLSGTAAHAQFAPSPRVPTERTSNPFGDPVPARPSIRRETQDIRARVDDGRESRQLSRREARRLKRQAVGIDLRAGVYGNDGLSEAEQRELAVRAQVLRDTVIARRSGIGPVPTRP